MKQNYIILVLVILVNSFFSINLMGQVGDKPVNYIFLIQTNLEKLNSKVDDIQRKKLRKRRGYREDIIDNLTTSQIPVKVETFYSDGSLLYSIDDFLRDIPSSIQDIKYSTKAKNCKLCQDKSGNYFVEASIKIDFQSDRKKQKKQLYISFFFEQNDEGKTRAYIARITSNTSPNRLKCYKKVDKIYPKIPEKVVRPSYGPVVSNDDKGKDDKTSKKTPKTTRSKPTTKKDEVIAADCTDKINQKTKELGETKRKIRQLEETLKKERGEKDKYTKDIARLRGDSIRLERTIVEWRIKYEVLDAEYKRVKKEMEEYKAYKNWADNDSLQCDSTKRANTEAFVWANEEYKEFIILKNSKYDTKNDIVKRLQRKYKSLCKCEKIPSNRDSLLKKVEMAMIKSIWDIYKVQEEKCIEKNGWTHLYTAKILANNDGNIIEELGENLCEQVKEMNKIVLRELGLALEKGPYDVRSQASSFAMRLPYLLFPDRKCEGNSEIVNEIKKIYAEYKKENFANSIGLYDRYQRLLTLKEFSENKPAIVAEAKFAAGAILLWNLDDITKYQGLLIEGSWLSKEITSRHSKGEKLINEAIKMMKVSDRDDKEKKEFIQDAYIILNKYYKTKNPK